MSAESQSTISMERQTVHSICNKFLQHDDDDLLNIQMLKDILREELEIRFLNQEPVTVSGLACFLDPRCKDMANETQHYREAVKEELLELMIKEDTCDEKTQSLSKNQRAEDLNYLFGPERALYDSFERMSSFDDSPRYLAKCQKEIDSYKKEQVILIEDNHLLWWNSKRHKFPLLSRFARKYLAIPASSTPSERVFSTAGNIISAKRSCLLPENANLLIFLYQNRDIIDEFTESQS
ncbi:E3 SUMO-protein ligase ZBED1-like [Microplitis demolitor]|uniref:E3 SUMO-protein ligase ZBED1-like n=1 Tax=Microplitis demolitor TaxID=69319 RepID=UPI00235B698E|nr:E3 SUMO-protein ligase ZBED1-like [Microplitis demolitor]